MFLERRLFIGSTFNFSTFVYNRDGSVVDLTGTTVRLTMRKGGVSGAIILTENTTGVTITKVDKSGYISVFIDGSVVTKTLTDDKYWFDVRLDFASGVEETLFSCMLTTVKTPTKQ